MSAKQLCSVVALLIGAAAGMATAAPARSPSSFAGRWRVAGVAVSDSGVQALVDDDPSLMGKRLIFTTRRLAWDRLPVTKDVCLGPAFTRLATPPAGDLRPQLRKLGMRDPIVYRLHCRVGGWGPGDRTVLYRDGGGVIAMLWYDGGLLKLVR